MWLYPSCVGGENAEPNNVFPAPTVLFEKNLCAAPTWTGARSNLPEGIELRLSTPHLDVPKIALQDEIVGNLARLFV